MKPEHKNMLLGLLASKSSQSMAGEGDWIPDLLFSLMLSFVVAVLTPVALSAGPQWFEFEVCWKLSHYLSTDLACDQIPSFRMSSGRKTGFAFLAFFISLFIFMKLFEKFNNFMYLLIFGPPVAYFLIWLFFLSS